MKQILVAASAVVDLDGIWLYVAEHDGVDTAQRLVESLTSRFSLLSRHPHAGKKRADLGRLIRSFSVGKYRIYYRSEPGAVRILHIWHGARDESSLGE